MPRTMKLFDPEPTPEPYKKRKPRGQFPRCHSGTFKTYLSRLRTLELITGPGIAIKASDEFFE